MALANCITLSRLLLVPVILWLTAHGHSGPAAAVFLLAACTDFVDGWVARTRHEVTSLGKLLDPLADKALQLGVLLAIVGSGYAPMWLVLLLLGKEVALVLGGLWMLRRGQVVSARATGKIASFFLFAAITAGLAGIRAMQPLLYLGTALSLAAGVDYLIQAVRTLSNKSITG